MKYLTFCFCFFGLLTATHAQFKVAEKGLTIIVTDGTDYSRNSDLVNPNDIPASYDQIGAKSSKNKNRTKNVIAFNDPIRELGMTECIQAAAFLERPEFGKLGFMLIFSLNDSIGGKQATMVRDGKVYQGVYRLIRQKLSSEEATPAGMTNYQIKGTFILLGIS